MAVDVHLTIRIPDPWDANGLRWAVNKIDESLSGEGQGIRPEKVKADDVLGVILVGELGVKYDIIEERIEDV
jgi:hypothetical protein